MTRRAPFPSFMHWVLPLMLALVACGIVLSGRDLSQMYNELVQGGEGVRHPAMAWLQRVVSLVLLVACAQRISEHIVSRKPVPSLALLGSYVAFWMGTVASPALLGAHREVAHEYLYPLIIGIAACLVTPGDIGRVIDGARNALFALMVVSVLLIPIAPAMVLDASYNQGFLPGVPRLGGVAPHPVAMGMFAQTALLLLWARPFQRRWLNVLAWIVGLSVLVLAQSKTAWIAFVLCSTCMFAVRTVPGLWKRMGDPREGAFGAVVCVVAMFAGVALLGLLLLGDVQGDVAEFLDTSEGARLMSMTGRDQIWAVAWEEWHAHKLFGYGPSLWNDEFRASIGLANATNGHNQFMDTIARAGSVGAVALVVYALVVFVLSLRYAKVTRGLSVALFVSLALRSVSEVPLLLFGYGTELFIHLLLVVTIAAGAARAREAAEVHRPRARSRARPTYGAAA